MILTGDGEDSVGVDGIARGDAPNRPPANLFPAYSLFADDGSPGTLRFLPRQLLLADSGDGDT